MTATETLVRARVKQVVEAEFAAEGFTVENDKLPRAAGRDGRNRLAVSPEEASEQFSDVTVLEVNVLLQFYLAFEAKPDENIAVDPGVIEGYADRLRTAFQANSDGGTGDFWFLRLTGIDYPDDPTGNKSRLEAHFTARASNPAGLPA